MIQTRRAYDLVKHFLGGKIEAVTPQWAVNMTIDQLVSMHDWQFLLGRTALIDIRATIASTTGASWVEDTMRLTSTGAFADYTWVPGDVLTVDSGTNVTAGRMEVLERVSDDAVVLAASPGSSAADITWHMGLNSAALPADFVRTRSTQATSGFLTDFLLVNEADIHAYRTYDSDTDSATFWRACITHAGPTYTPILEVWPASGTAQIGVISLFYKSGIGPVVGDSGVIPMPSWLELLFVEVLQAVCEGLEYGDSATVSPRVTALMQGSVYRAAVARDGSEVFSLGEATGGAIESMTEGQYGDVWTTLSRIGEPE